MHWTVNGPGVSELVESCEHVLEVDQLRRKDIFVLTDSSERHMVSLSTG